MTQSTTDRSFILVFRLLMAWTFLYAASHQVFNPKFSAAAFLSHTKTFHDVYAVLATPAADPVLTFLVSYGHLLIGLSLLVGLRERQSTPAGILPALRLTDLFDLAGGGAAGVLHDTGGNLAPEP